MNQKPIQLLDISFTPEELQPLQSYLNTCSHWNEHKERTVLGSPHREADDIWARYALKTDPEMQAGRPFKSFWYYDDLTDHLLPFVGQLFDHVEGKELGGVLITRIPANKEVYPHTDYGWHANYHSKYCIGLRAHHNQTFAYKDTELRTNTGQCFWFDNSEQHWVKNDSNEDRISIIVCIKTDRGVHKP